LRLLAPNRLFRPAFGHGISGISVHRGSGMPLPGLTGSRVLSRFLIAAVASRRVIRLFVWAEFHPNQACFSGSCGIARIKCRISKG